MTKIHIPRPLGTAAEIQEDLRSQDVLEEIRQAKKDLEAALLRARNRDSLNTVVGSIQPGEEWEQEGAARWINPPTYTTVTWQPQWSSLEKVPVGVVVRDNEGDDWKIKADGRLKVRFNSDKKPKWQKANEAGYRLSAWDHFGPFTEVKK